MRLLLTNPNTSADMTNHIVAAAKAVARPDTEIKGVTGASVRITSRSEPRPQSPLTRRSMPTSVTAATRPWLSSPQPSARRQQITVWRP
jgi:hypothetical protein